MIKLYDTSKELFFDTDYVFIRDNVNGFKTNDMPYIIENLTDALINANDNHAELLENNLFRDIAEVKKQYVIRMVSCSSSGTIADYICNTKYKAVDKAVNNSIIWLAEKATEEELFQLDTSPEGIKETVVNCYHMNT